MINSNFIALAVLVFASLIASDYASKCDPRCPAPGPLPYTVLLPHETDCSKFYSCSNCVPILMECPAGLLFNDGIQVCDYPDNVKCGGNNNSNESDENNNGNDSIDDDSTSDDSNSSSNSTEENNKSNSNDDDSTDNSSTDNSSNGNDDSTDDNSSSDNDDNTDNSDNSSTSSESSSEESSTTEKSTSTTTTNAPKSTTENSEECDLGCPNPDPLDHTVHLPHESDCSKFYKCDHCKKVEFDCPANLLFNKDLEVCDWPENVDCDGENSGTTEDDNSSSPVPTTTTSEATTASETTTDAPEPTTTTSEATTASETTTDAPTTTESDENNNGDCDAECPNPDPLDHTVHLPHETDCSKFYKCDHCKKVEFDCPANLLFNKDLEVCDWPENVDCDGENSGTTEDDNSSSPVPTTTTSEATTASETTTDAPEPTTTTSEATTASETTTDAPTTTESDENNNGDCDAECPNPDPLDHTVHLPHETDCSKFYKCDHCKKVEFDCPANLLFNKDLEVCDWPENVDCDGENSGTTEDDNSSSPAPTTTTSEATTASETTTDAPEPTTTTSEATTASETTTNAPTTTESDENNNGDCDAECPNPDPLDHTVHLPHETDCSKFYKCDHCKKVEFDCPANLLFNKDLEVCDWPENVDCDGENSGTTEDDNSSSPVPTTTTSEATTASETTTDAPEPTTTTSEATTASETTTDAPTTTESDENNNGDCDAECPNPDPLDHTVHLPHETDCSKFYKCDHCKKVEFDCPANLLFNKDLEVCDWPENVDCDGENSGTTEDDNSSSPAPTTTTSEATTASETTTDAPEPTTTTSEATTASETTTHAPTTTESDENNNGDCDAECPNPDPLDHTVHLPHETDCSKFYKCDHCKKVEFDCPANLLFNKDLEVCDWPENVDCDGENSGTTEDDNSSSPVPTTTTSEATTASETTTDAPEPTTTTSEATTASETTTNAPTTTESDENNNGDCDAECPNPDPLDHTVHLPHETDCSKFYKCDHCKKVEFDCPANLLFNKDLEVCDWPENVDCDGENSGTTEDDNSSSPVPTTTTSEATTASETTTDAPEPTTTTSEATTASETTTNAPTTTESDENNNGDCDAECPNPDPLDHTVHLPHETDCSKFYKCDHCKKVEFDCPANLLFNKDLEVCDWPENVDCDGENSGTTEDDNSSSPVPTTTTSEATTASETTTDAPEPTTTTSEATTASETTTNAPTTTESDENNNGDCDAECPNPDPLDHTVHLPHETDCSKFYKCDHCKKVEFDCPANLLFNKDLEVCDWPENVDCDGENSGTTEDDNSSSPVPTTTTSEATTASETTTDAPKPTTTTSEATTASETTTNAPTTTESDENNNGDCDAECPNPDPLDHTVHLPHESVCSKFYKCDNCKKVEFDCPADLLFNKDLEVCDWPENVDCDGENSGTTEDDNSSSPVPTTTSEPTTASETTTNVPQPTTTTSEATTASKSTTGAPQPTTTESDGNNNGNCDAECPIPDPLDHTVHLPHETDCSKFYKCDNCKKVEFDCPGGLQFNRELEVCDWPVNVDCKLKLY